jgi:hypothetical protein
MGDEATQTAGDAGEKSQGELDAAAEAAKAAGKPKTRYMVLWSRVPQEEDHEYRWLEIGWYEAHSQAGARKLAGTDENSGTHGRIVDAAKEGPIQLRAIPESSWPAKVEASAVETTHALVIR